MKKKVRVFLSFECGKDNKLHRNFYSRSERYSQYEIIDCSLNEQYHPDARWAELQIESLRRGYDEARVANRVKFPARLLKRVALGILKG